MLEETGNFGQESLSINPEQRGTSIRESQLTSLAQEIINKILLTERGAKKDNVDALGFLMVIPFKSWPYKPKEELNVQGASLGALLVVKQLEVKFLTSLLSSCINSQSVKEEEIAIDRPENSSETMPALYTEKIERIKII